MQKSSSFYKLVGYYAEAFFNVFGDTIDAEEYKRMKQAGQALAKNYQLMNLLQVSFAYHHEVKKKCIEHIVIQFALPKTVFNLAMLLIEAERVHILPYILKKIVLLYEEKMNIMEMHVYSSHPLSSDVQLQIKQMLSTACKVTVQATITVDATLIAGIKAYSNTVMWENSIKKTLKALHAHLKK